MTSEDDGIPVPSQGGFARSWDDLASALGVDERSLFNFRKKHAPRIKELGRTLTRADGRHCVAEWRKLGDELGELKGKGINNPDANYQDERALRLRREKVQLDIAEFNLEKAKEQMLAIAEFEAALAVTVGNFRSVGDRLSGRASAKVATRATVAILRMLKEVLTAKQYEKVESAITAAPIDFADVEEILQNEWDLVLRTLETCEYLRTPPQPEWVE